MTCLERINSQIKLPIQTTQQHITNFFRIVVILDLIEQQNLKKLIYGIIEKNC